MSLRKRPRGYPTTKSYCFEAEMKKDTNDISEEITASLKKGPLFFRELQVAVATSLQVGIGDRYLDRALQKLRKAGKIRVEGRRWVADSVKICPSCEGKGWITL
jgi:hypothetical protein